MNKEIRLLVESFFDDEIFNVGNDIKTDIEDLGRYYDYQVSDIYYLNDKPYAVCCGDKKYFNDNKFRFCLLNDSIKELEWRKSNELVKELLCFKFKHFLLNTFNDFQHIDENGYKNTQIIKNNYNISEFPAFEKCIELGDNIYLPAIDELLMLYLNKDKLKDTTVFDNGLYCSSTLHSTYTTGYITLSYGFVGIYRKYCKFRIRPFFHLD